MNAFWQSIVGALGIDSQPEKLHFSQLALRGVVVFIVALALMRAGHKRSLSRKTAFDTTFVVIIAAVLARAINGSGPFFPTIGVSILLAFLHRSLSFLAYRWPGFENLIKGRAKVLVRDGRAIPESMRRVNVTEGDLDEDLHLRGHAGAEEIALARLERSGDISFIEK